MAEIKNIDFNDGKTPIFTALAIGDPHFKKDNKIEADMMIDQIREIILRLKPDIVICLGDMLHEHEKIDLLCHSRITKFLRMLKCVSPHIYVIQGNHDFQTPDDFLSGEHGFNQLKEWDRTTVVDQPIISEHVGKDGKLYTFGFVPFVPPGRLEEALKIGGMEAPYEQISCLFAHQEFRGAKMGSIVSKIGDEWKPEYPLCCSGHIHSFSFLQENLLYTGSSLQVGFGDSDFKSLSMLFFGPSIGESKRATFLRHEHVMMDIPKRLKLKMDVEELLEYAKSAIIGINDKIKIKLKDEVVKVRRALEMDDVKRIIKQGVIIQVYDTTPLASKTIINEMVKTKIAFQTRLANAVQGLQDEKVRGEFFELFPSMK